MAGLTLLNEWIKEAVGSTNGAGRLVAVAAQFDVDAALIADISMGAALVGAGISGYLWLTAEF